MKKLLGVSLALVMLIGSVPLGFSETLRVQLEQGIEIDQIQCDNPNHVLVLRTNGNVACVTEKGAEKMGWEKVTFIFHQSFINDGIAKVTQLSLTDVFIKSQVEEADIELGLYSKYLELQEVLRSPKMYPFSHKSIIIDSQNPVPTVKQSVISMYATENGITEQTYVQERTAVLEKYLKYFPDYVPDGMELKFYAIGEGGANRIYVSENPNGTEPISITKAKETPSSFFILMQNSLIIY